MFMVASTIATVVAIAVAAVFGLLRLHPSRSELAVALRTGAIVAAVTLGAGALLTIGDTADAAIVPTVPLATSANYAVLGGTTVTNTNNSVLDGSLGLWPGPDITGFPPGQVLPPGTTDENNAAAQQAQSDLTAAYLNAAGRPINATTTADLSGLTLQGGVYAAPSHGALGLAGTVTLDGAGNPNTVFIFQTDSTLITGPGSTVSLINGAQECNVFWQVGSSATLDTGSVFVGNIMALTSITVNNSVTVHGRALARNGAVTLDNDVFTEPTCATLGGTTTTTEQGTPTTTQQGTPTSVIARGGPGPISPPAAAQPGPTTTTTPSALTPPGLTPPGQTPPGQTPPGASPPAAIPPTPDVPSYTG